MRNNSPSTNCSSYLSTEIGAISPKLRHFIAKIRGTNRPPSFPVRKRESGFHMGVQFLRFERKKARVPNEPAPQTPLRGRCPLTGMICVANAASIGSPCRRHRRLWRHESPKWPMAARRSLDQWRLDAASASAHPLAHSYYRTNILKRQCPPGESAGLSQSQKAWESPPHFDKLSAGLASRHKTGASAPTLRVRCHGAETAVFGESSRQTSRWQLEAASGSGACPTVIPMRG